MAREAKFSLTFDEPWKGTMLIEDDGGTEPPPGNGNGDPPPDPPPTVEDDYHWYDTGEDISILTGDKKLNDKLIESQMVYRSGQFWGFIILNPSSPIAGEPIRVYPRGGHIPFRSEGLANFGKTFGNGSFANKSAEDGRYAQVRWIRDDNNGLGIEFMVPDKGKGDRWSRIKKSFPETWETYGLMLTWNIGVP